MTAMLTIPDKIMWLALALTMTLAMTPRDPLWLWDRLHGPATAVVRPAETVCSRTAWAVVPNAEPSPFTVTAAEPLPPPKMTLT